MELTAREIAALTGGTVVAGDADARATSFAIDSRTLAPGACFVALRRRARRPRLRGRRVRTRRPSSRWSRATSARRAAGTIVRVDDALAALARLGRAARDRLPDATVVGHHRFGRQDGHQGPHRGRAAPKFQVHASPGSFNNEIGLPLTLLAAHVGDGDAGAGDGRARPRRHRRALRDRPPDGRRDHQHRAGPRRAARWPDRHRPGEGRAARGARRPRSGRARRRRPRDARARRPHRRPRAARVAHTVRGRARCARTGITLDAELRPSFTLDSPWGSGPVAPRGARRPPGGERGLAAAVALAHGVAVRRGRGRSGRRRARAVAHGDRSHRRRRAGARRRLQREPVVDGRGAGGTCPGRRARPPHRRARRDARARRPQRARARRPRRAAWGPTAVDALVVVGAEAAPLAAAARAAPA